MASYKIVLSGVLLAVLCIAPGHTRPQTTGPVKCGNVTCKPNQFCQPSSGPCIPVDLPRKTCKLPPGTCVDIHRVTRDTSGVQCDREVCKPGWECKQTVYVNCIRGVPCKQPPRECVDPNVKITPKPRPSVSA